MSDIGLLAAGAVSGFGLGRDAFYIGGVGERARTAIKVDRELERAALVRPVAVRADERFRMGGEPAARLLALAFEQCLAELGAVRPGWSKERVGLVLGTSAGAMDSAQKFFTARASRIPIERAVARGATYFAPLDAAIPPSFSPRVLLLGACASSSLALGIAMRWIELDRCDIALAGGFDALSLFVAAGFESLRATTASAPRPFRIDRDGLALGEGAAVVALGRAPRAVAYLAGFGASTDAVHLTAPDATGSGLARAAACAMADARFSAADIGFVSAHATATPFNDPAEAQAIERVLGSTRPVHPFKAQIGHTLGASGALETLAACDAMARDILPGAAGQGEIDPMCSVTLLERNRQGRSRAVLKLSSAFGGANAALVLTRSAGPSRRKIAREVYLAGHACVSAPSSFQELQAALAGAHPHLHRLDRLAALSLTAVQRLKEQVGPFSAAGIVAGHGLASLEQNEAFWMRLSERGARHVEPRRFPSTSPNAAAGECAIAFRLTGPSFAVGASLHAGLEALSVARDLLAAGDADAMVVVAADVTGPASTALLESAGARPSGEGACAALLTARPIGRARCLAEVARDRAPGEDTWSGVWGHAELSEWLSLHA